mmetsp:Transcript_12622/g.25268  ORF Transcript_12622/g.25268 Transcript_12622/m.25268 type:complete len:278 (+) Transcript_12622:70-903(+)
MLSDPKDSPTQEIKPPSPAMGTSDTNRTPSASTSNPVPPPPKTTSPEDWSTRTSLKDRRRTAPGRTHAKAHTGSYDAAPGSDQRTSAATPALRHAPDPDFLQAAKTEEGTRDASAVTIRSFPAKAGDEKTAAAAPGSAEKLNSGEGAGTPPWTDGGPFPPMIQTDRTFRARSGAASRAHCARLVRGPRHSRSAPPSAQLPRASATIRRAALPPSESETCRGFHEGDGRSRTKLRIFIRRAGSHTESSLAFRLAGAPPTAIAGTAPGGKRPDRNRAPS